MIKAGITGGIGSGKSTVCKIFEMLGTPVFYADDVAKELYNTSNELKSQIIQHFGVDIYVDGIFNRDHMKKIVFSDPDKLQLLNSLVHPMVKVATEKWLAAQRSPYAIKEAALLIESGSYENLDEIIFVESPLTLRINRVMQRDQLSETQILQRINAQMPDEEKKQFATQVIINDEMQLLIPQVLALHHHFIKKSHALKKPADY